MEAFQLQEHLQPVLSGVSSQLGNLKKYESTFSKNSKQAYDRVVQGTQDNENIVNAWVPHSGTSAYLSTGALDELSKATNSMLHLLNSILGGELPLPRAAKEELTTAAQKLAALKPQISIPEDRAKVEAKLMDLFAAGVEQTMDPDTIEMQVDQTTEQVLGDLYGASHLDEEDLQRELEWLTEAVERTGKRHHYAVYSLTLNSLERLHGKHAKKEGEKEGQTEEPETMDEGTESHVGEDEDEDDPFSMPLPTNVMELAEKYREIAEPIKQENAASKETPMLEMQADNSSKDLASSAGPEFTKADYELVQTPEGTATKEGGQVPPDKLSKLHEFLQSQGQNQGSCTFHAQMRLSTEGCQKLAKFLENSGRIKALSLSANYLGDDGIGIICQGLKKNKTVASIDFPNNNISDEGALIIAEAIKDNLTLTQLELGANKIGDKGAIAIASVIKYNSHLKKVGLSYNKIGKDGCTALADAAKANPCIKHIQMLPGNCITEKDAKMLTKAISTNKNKFSIRSLFNIPENIDWSGQRELARWTAKRQESKQREAEQSRKSGDSKANSQSSGNAREMEKVDSKRGKSGSGQSSANAREMEKVDSKMSNATLEQQDSGKKSEKSGSGEEKQQESS